MKILSCSFGDLHRIQWFRLSGDLQSLWKFVNECGWIQEFV